VLVVGSVVLSYWIYRTDDDKKLLELYGKQWPYNLKSPRVEGKALEPYLDKKLGKTTVQSREHH
jgi:hypothetical protein